MGRVGCFEVWLRGSRLRERPECRSAFLRLNSSRSLSATIFFSRPAEIFERVVGDGQLTDELLQALVLGLENLSPTISLRTRQRLFTSFNEPGSPIVGERRRNRVLST
jgi:hypothetical protein